jgi:hypothetical protein
MKPDGSFTVAATVNSFHTLSSLKYKVGYQAGINSKSSMQ